MKLETTELNWFVRKTSDRDETFYILVEEELQRAREKFPSSILSMTALVEEVGELAKALLHYRAGKCEFSHIIEEAAQVAVMAQRVAVEGDASINNADYQEPNNET